MVKPKQLDQVQCGVQMLIGNASAPSQLVETICGVVLNRKWCLLVWKKGGALRGKRNFEILLYKGKTPGSARPLGENNGSDFL
jgi:hypothetical protein